MHKEKLEPQLKTKYCANVAVLALVIYSTTFVYIFKIVELRTSPFLNQLSSWSGAHCRGLISCCCTYKRICGDRTP